MLNEVSYLTVLVVKRVEIELCKGGSAGSDQDPISILLLHGTQANQNAYRILILAGATDCDFVDFQGWLAYPYWD